MRVVITAPEVQPMALAMVAPALPAGTSRQMVVGEGYSLTWGDAEALPRLPTKPTLSNAEAFAFEVTSRGVAVRATSAEGLFRGCAWLRREVAQGQLPCGVGEDGPELAVRGVMLDVSRNRVYSVKTVCEVVDWMAQLGLNQLELYFENVFAYRDHAAVWAQTSPYTPADLAAIEAYCAARFVHFVPNQNTLGHFERWLKHPDYLRYAELPQGGARTPWGSIQAHPTGLFAADEATRTFVKGLLEELLPCFPKATRVNLGGDEVFDLGQGRSNPTDKAGLYLGYMREMAAVAKRHGKQPELWADMLLRHPEMI
ncbi:MAG: family 20 glycosylhydrolase, partial [Kiritimatiellae bacterium]|nr:family 20 glycosylhydrolase [Kiritimatiellia bacterium]